MAHSLTIHELLRQKGNRKWLQLHVDNDSEAEAAVVAGIMILSCEPSHMLESIRTAAPGAFVSVGMPHGTVSSPQEAIREGFKILKRGADAVYCSHSPQCIEAMAREGIPVTGHVGLVPNLAMWTGYRAVGRTSEEALKVFRKVKDLENAGAACIEVEVVPVELADYITRSTACITMGMGCGTACDTQYLFSCDVLGTHDGHYPRHSKKYADLAVLESQMQAQRVAAFKAFAAEVESAAFPGPTHEVRMDDASYNRFLSLAEKT